MLTLNISRSKLVYCNFSSSKLDQWPLSSLGRTLTWGFWGSPARWLGPWVEEPHFPPACKHSRYLLLKNNKHWLKNNKLIYFRMGSVYSARQQLNTYFSIAKRLSRSLFYCNFSSSKLDQWPLSSLGRSLPWGFWGSPARWLGPWVEEPHFPPACKHSRYLLLKNNKHWLKK